MDFFGRDSLDILLGSFWDLLDLGGGSFKDVEDVRGLFDDGWRWFGPVEWLKTQENDFSTWNSNGNWIDIDDENERRDANV